MIQELEEYRRALKIGKRIERQRLQYGENPCIPVLEQFLPRTQILSQESLGLIDIPLSQVVGTAYEGRQSCFSWGFMPLMPEGSEFAAKWMALCKAHVTEGIQDSVVAVEFMNRYYLVEGHKRVSILKYFGAASIPGRVTRMIPAPEDSKESRIYQEFLNFYRISKQNDVLFSEEGGYLALIKAIHGESSRTKDFSEAPAPEPVLPLKKGEEAQPDTSPALPWSETRKEEFHSFFRSFSQAFQEKSEDKLTITPADALLVYLQVFPYEESKGKTAPVLKRELSLIWNEIENRDKAADIHLILHPSKNRSLLPSLSSGIRKIAFLHNKNPEVSSWVYAHELGRKDLEQEYAGKLETFAISDVDSEEQADEAFAEALSRGADLIFTTSPVLLNASVRAALANPKAKILNCSLNTNHPAVRTYYARMYEAKFLMGVIAGSMAENDQIGYLADYPIFGSTANINAFALGTQMVNPRAKIKLFWSKTWGEDSRKKMAESGISYFSDADMLTKNDNYGRIGFYRYLDGKAQNTAFSPWRWGEMYSRIVRSILDGGWKNDASGTRATAYFFGMDAGVVDLVPAEGLPEGISRTVSLLRRELMEGRFLPFSARITDQSGTVHDFRHSPMTPEEIITMDWLNENVIGSIPEFSELLPEARTLVKIQGIKKP